MFPFVAITEYVEPSFVVSHLSVDSFQRRTTFAESPRSTSMPELSDGEPVAFEFRTTMLSSTKSVSVLRVVVVPLTVRFPPTTTSPEV